MKTSMKVAELLVLGLLFFAVANPKTYDLVAKVVPSVKDDDCTTQLGVGLHAVVFMLAVALIGMMQARMMK